MTEIIEKSGGHRVRLEVQQDSESSNPRTNQDCNLTNVITPKDQRYIDVDADGGPLQDGWDRFTADYASKDRVVEVFTRWARIFHGTTVVEDRPHDGSWSLWYITPEKLAETTWPAEKAIEAEIKEYRMWAEGEVYGCIIEKAVGWSRLDKKVDIRVTWEEVDSCWGLVGREYAESFAREEFGPYREGAA